MVSALTAGLVFGLSAGVAPGPLLALVITQTLKHNAREGMKVAMAPFLTDLPIILLSWLLSTQLANFSHWLGLVSLVGGCYLLYLAYQSFRTKPVTFTLIEDQPQSLRKGVLINALSPHPYLFWLTVGLPFIFQVQKEGMFAPLLFIAGFYSLLVGSQVFLAIIVGRSRVILKSKGYLLALRILAGMLVFFAVVLLKNGLVLLGILR